MRKNLKFLKFFSILPSVALFCPKQKKSCSLKRRTPIEIISVFFNKGFGKAPPNKIPLGHNERAANYGTLVESCSGNSRSAPTIKLRISPSAACNDGKRILPKI